MTVAAPGSPAGSLRSLDKAVPPWADGLTAAEMLGRAPRLSSLGTPLLVLDETALAQNLREFARWCAAHDLDLEPHGKTTMAPTLWQRQLDAGATAITVANYPQLRAAVAAGVRQIHVANTLADSAGLRWLGAALDADPDLAVTVWADSLDTVELMNAELAGATRPPTVLVEVGGSGGRTGARTIPRGIAIGEAVAASSSLRLGGVAGYEGAFAHDTSAESFAAVDAYLGTLAETHRGLAASYPDDGRIVVSAGGSAYFDRVVAVLGELRDDRTRVVVRSGAYVIHDDGFYRGITPAGRTEDAPDLRSAMHVWARVISRPEPGLALLDVGKRDVPFDEGLPTPQVAAPSLGGTSRFLDGTVTAVNDQHAFLEIDVNDPLRIGDVVRLGLSHPCTALDKWRTIPVLDGDGDDPVVVDLLATYF